MTRSEFDSLVYQGRRAWKTRDCTAMRRLTNRRYRRCLSAALREGTYYPERRRRG